MKRTRIILLLEKHGWTKALADRELRTQKNVPGSICELTDNDDPPGWRLTVTRDYPDP